MKKNILVRIGYILIIPITLVLLFTYLSAGFKLTSLHIVLNQAILPLVIALGVSFSFVVGIFEMSIGSQVILSAIVGGIMCQYFGVVGLFVGSIGTGIILGCIMGTVYRFLRIPTMVISLGMLMIFEVTGQLLTKGIGYASVDSSVMAVYSFPNNYIIAIIAGSIFYLIFHKTKFGYATRALGNNDVVGVNLGISNNEVKFKTYVMGGMFYGLAGALYLCYAGSIAAKLNLGSMSMMFGPIISVLLGLELKKIVNNFPLTIAIGAFSVTMLSTGLVAVGLPGTLQDVMTGVFMLGVMIFSTNHERVGEYLERRKMAKQLSDI